MDMANTLPRPAVDREFPFTDRDFRRACELIHRHAGISLGPGKRDMVYGRLSRRLRALGLTSFRAYLEHLDENERGECGVRQFPHPQHHLVLPRATTSTAEGDMIARVDERRPLRRGSRGLDREEN